MEEQETQLTKLDDCKLGIFAAWWRSINGLSISFVRGKDAADPWIYIYNCCIFSSSRKWLESHQPRLCHFTKNPDHIYTKSITILNR